MQKNKFTTYLLYAVGEIVLIVIGILIAVSLNNWNQDRKERKEEKELLLSFLEEYEENFSQARILWFHHRRQDPQIRQLLDFIGDGSKYANSEEMIGFLNYLPITDFDLTISSYAINSGRHTILRNEEIKKNIQLLVPAIQDLLNIHSTIQNEIIQMQDDPVIRKYYRYREFRFPVGYGDAGPSKHNVSTDLLINEPVFETYIENIRIQNANLNNQILYVSQNLEEIIDQIKVELKTFDIQLERVPFEIEPIIFPFNDMDRPVHSYGIWGSPGFPRWRNFTDSLVVEFPANNDWSSWNSGISASLNGDQLTRDYSKYSRILLTLRAEKQERLLFGIKDKDDPDAETGHEAEMILSNRWQTFEIPLAQYADFDPSNCKYLKLIHLGQEALNLHIKRIEFVE